MSDCLTTASTSSSQADIERSHPRGHGRPGPSRRQPDAGLNGQISEETAARQSGSASGRGRRPRRPRETGGTEPGRNVAHVAGEGVSSTNTSDQGALGVSGSSNKPPRRRRRPNRPLPADPPQLSEASTPTSIARAEAGMSGQPSGPQSRIRRNRRAERFNSALTETTPTPQTQTVQAKPGDSRPSEKYRSTAPKADDLTSRLKHELGTPPYLDCLICFAAIHPGQPTWSCLPSMPVTAAGDDGADGADGAGNEHRAGETAQCCWTTFHLKCIRSWAVKSVKDVVEAWRARGEERIGEWRCPGCQSKRTAVPNTYWCFCGSTPDPKPPRLATPHSCSNPCSRPRVCGHACPLLCHPGPCPPCQVTTQLPCHCRKQVLSFKCAHLAPSKAGNKSAAELSCERQCGRRLLCGNHVCEEECHPGPCLPCSILDRAKCFCGKEEMQVWCNADKKDCVVIEQGQVRRWTGRFECQSTCERLFDCGVHRCAKRCHVPSATPAPCPRSPSLVTHCPCGKHPLVSSSAPFFPSGTVLTRTACTDPIPSCKSVCMKTLPGCSHACTARCHSAPCPPCSIILVRPCRCGATTCDIPCAEAQLGTKEFLCERPCAALRACGRHQCNRLCCPLASVAGAKGKRKKRVGVTTDAVLIDEAGWHECDLACGKMLSCGNHRCEKRDHRGACPPCLRSSFEEIICSCGRTVLEPPIPCGTRINCTFPCARPPPTCGHPKTQHTCHEDPTSCPPCPFLASKRCACGKKMVDNVRCSQEKVSCGTTCGKLLSCGFHHCERLCHGDACGPCSAVCGKPRKLCLPAHHHCTLPCHAPGACSEAAPCHAIITLTCPCGRIRQPVPCGRSTSNPAGREGTQQLKCSNECLIAKRNARLADALGINPDRVEGRDKQMTYNDGLLAFARVNQKFCTMVERSFSEFLASDKKSQILAHMPEARRKFVHDLAAVYRMDTQMVDQEPQRSVQLFRRIDSRIPSPLLSVTATAPSSSSGFPSSSSLGKLTDLRAPVAVHPTRQRISPTPTPPPASGASSSGGWRAVVARQTRPTQNACSLPNERTAVSRPSSTSRPYPPSQIQLADANTVHPVEGVPDNWEDEV
ncbi:hypothetical protein AcV5_000275 [Taiwanofungus camphoratus]|nr:hypothetical protein AcV5_000275 [Antrodia cinnamomea]